MFRFSALGAVRKLVMLSLATYGALAAYHDFLACPEPSIEDENVFPSRGQPVNLGLTLRNLSRYQLWTGDMQLPKDPQPRVLEVYTSNGGRLTLCLYLTGQAEPCRYVVNDAVLSHREKGRLVFAVQHDTIIAQVNPSHW